VQASVQRAGAAHITREVEVEASRVEVELKGWLLFAVNGAGSIEIETPASKRQDLVLGAVRERSRRPKAAAGLLSTIRPKPFAEVPKTDSPRSDQRVLRRAAAMGTRLMPPLLHWPSLARREVLPRHQAAFSAGRGSELSRRGLFLPTVPSSAREMLTQYGVSRKEQPSREPYGTSDPRNRR
jgi:hypothetical protein